MTIKQTIGSVAMRPILTQDDFFEYTIEIITRMRKVFFSVFFLSLVVGLLPYSFLTGNLTFINYTPIIYRILSFVIDYSVKEMLYLEDIQIIITSPLSVISICIQLAIMLALLINAPYFCYQFYQFVAPGLYPNERRTLFESLMIMGGLFFLGALIAYLFVVPITLGVLTTITIPFLDYGTTPMVLFYTLDAVFSLIFWTVISTGFLYTLPMIIYVLVILDIIDPTYLETKKKNVIISIFIFAAIITPDPTLVSMMLISLPLVGINEFIINKGLIAKRQINLKRLRRFKYASV